MGAAPSRRELSDRKTREVAGTSAAVLFSLSAVLEFVRLQNDAAPWPGFTTTTDWLFSLLAIVLWIGSAFVLAARRREHVLLAIAGTFALFTFGLVGTIAGSRLGLLYVAFALTLPVLERLALGRPPYAPHAPYDARRASSASSF